MDHKIFVVMRSGICARTTRTPVLNGTLQSIHRFYGNICASKNGRIDRRNGGLRVYFCMIKGMNLQNNSVGRMVYHLMMYTPSGINNRSYPQLPLIFLNLCEHFAVLHNILENDMNEFRIISLHNGKH